jgi:hypothetical protein
MSGYVCIVRKPQPPPPARSHDATQDVGTTLIICSSITLPTNYMLALLIQRESRALDGHTCLAVQDMPDAVTTYNFRHTRPAGQAKRNITS